MLSFSRLAMMVGLLALAGATRAQDRIPWAAGLEQAQRAANDERKLVLLHFYNDHCQPCVLVERNVFSQPQVAEAIARNYVPVKIHAGAQPKIAEQFRVDRWPTDIICTPAGQEIMRTTSPKEAEAYIGLVNQVALQTGVGTGRQWQTTMQAAGAQVLDPRVAQAQAMAGQAAQRANAAVGQAGTTLQGYGQFAQQQAAQANQQFAQTAQQAQGAAQGVVQGTAQQWTQRTDSTAQQLGNTAQQLGNTAQQFGGTAQEMNSLVQNTGRDLRAAWVPGGLGAGAAATGSPGAPSGSAYAQFAQQPEPQQPAFAQQAPAEQIAAQQPTMQQPAVQPPAQPSLPTSNPFLQAQSPLPAAAPQFVTSQPLPQSAASQQPTFQQSQTQRLQPPQPPMQAPPQAANLAGSPSPALTADQGLVPADRAPPIALEAYCPVTLLEQRKWKAGNRQFGAIHRDRTYLFASEVEKQKFLANYEAYSVVLSGFDPVIFAQRGQLVEGKRSYGLTYKDQIFLFADEASLQVFSKSPQAYADAARQATIQLDSSIKYR